jgi:membrane-associated protein
LRSVLQGLVDLAHDALSSPWGYLALFSFAAVDAFLPMVPSESLVVTAGVFAASGKPELVLVIVAAGLGALVGDHISYGIGRSAGSRLLRRSREGSRQRRAFDWAAATLAQRGGVVLIVSRYVPGGRTAVTLTMGTIAYPRRAFFVFDALAAISWAIYGALIGYIGGHAFEDQPLLGLALGLGLAVAIAGLIEVVRHVLARRRRGRQPVG